MPPTQPPPRACPIENKDTDISELSKLSSGGNPKLGLKLRRGGPARALGLLASARETMRDGAASRKGGATAGNRGDDGGKASGRGQAGERRDSGADVSSDISYHLQDAVLLEIMSLVIDDVNLLTLSLVCSRWSEVVRQEEVWQGKYIDIGERNISRRTLQAWYPRWRRGTVEMTNREKDKLVSANEQRHVLYHPWATGRRRDAVSLPWATVVIRDRPKAVCLTRFRAPLDARIYQDMSTRRINDIIDIGWTSARSHAEYARMVNRARYRDRISGDVLVGTELWPVGRYESEYDVHFEDIRHPPLCFSENAMWICDLRLDLEQQSLTVKTPLNEERTLRMFSGRRGDTPFDEDLKLFVAVDIIPPEEAADLPAVHIDGTIFVPK